MLMSIIIIKTLYRKKCRIKVKFGKYLKKNMNMNKPF